MTTPLKSKPKTPKSQKPTPRTLTPISKSKETDTSRADPDWDVIAAEMIDVSVNDNVLPPSDPKGDEVDGGEPQPVDSETPASHDGFSTAQVKLARDSFYALLCGGFNYGNRAFVKRAEIQGGPLKSLDLTTYGDVGRGAADNIFDRLCDYPFLKRWLVKLGPTEEFMARWGGIVVLAIAMKDAVPREIAQRQQDTKDIQEKEEKSA